MAVLFLLCLTSLSNLMVSDYNFQKGSMLFYYLDGKGGEYDGDGNIIVTADEADAAPLLSATQQSSNLVKVASASSSFWAGSSAGSSQEDAAAEPAVKTISSNQIEEPNSSHMLVQGIYLVSTGSPEGETSEEERYGITKYAVQEGDTPSSIATSFGVSTYTILWANNLKVSSVIKPGQTLEILPVTGVKHVVVPTDTAESIAAKYKADAEEIIIFNELPANGQLTAGRTLIVPNGEKEKPVDEPAPIPAQSKVQSSTKVAATTKSLGGHKFPYGQCTWYVSTRFFVPWGGNAKAWLVNAQAYGYQTGRTPVAGSIVVTNESRYYGHVAYVESVTPTTITLSEMNYVGWARKSVRVLSRDSGVIRGYIYNK